MSAIGQGQIAAGQAATTAPQVTPPGGQLPAGPRPALLALPAPPTPKMQRAADPAPSTVETQPRPKALPDRLQWQAARAADPKHTWWPMLPRWAGAVGSAKRNHWAHNGPAHKYDRITGASSRQHQLDHRRRSLVGGASYLLGGQTGLDTFNAGHCNQEAMRQAFFDHPRHSVTRPAVGSDGGGQVVLSPLDIEGLVVLCMDDLVDRTQGNGGFDYLGWRYLSDVEAKAFGVSDDDPRRRRDDPAPHELIKFLDEQQAQIRRCGLILECNPDQGVDNQYFDSGEVVRGHEPPAGFERSMAPAQGELSFYDLRFSQREPDGRNVQMQAWVHRAPDGTLSSGYVRPPVHRRLLGLNSTNPDFYWMAYLDSEVEIGAPWVGFADSTNPDLDMFEVWKLYVESLGWDWQAVAARYPERVAAHAKIVAARTRGAQSP